MLYEYSAVNAQIYKFRHGSHLFLRPYLYPHGHMVTQNSLLTIAGKPGRISLFAYDKGT
ncbi:hypothetical protein GCM10023091_30330 [Ravibacter arvi]|uniref:Uncharacterized protein n=1 Tax=Ravibacter arvi TaxID=2051041 RepID=A0ABP8M4J7_9BACT